ncbi:hypothetical protein L1049_028489 [Liquidambar formosana]|uniref:Uncharacterized protein n=1 Tax=Liquidambar formosana TaxID=63359 RepID=A0AAP0RKN0_LIQFO
MATKEPSTQSQEHKGGAKVPSLATQTHHVSTTHHHCITTLQGHSSYISSLTLAGKLLYTGSSNNEIRSWKRNPLNSDHNEPTNNIVAIGKGAVKSIVVLSNKLFTAHQDHKIRVWKINEHEPSQHQQKYTRIATLPTLGDRALKVLIPKNHVQVRRHKKSTWVHHSVTNAHDDAINAVALSTDGSVYTGSADKKIKVWRKNPDEKKHSLVDTLEKHNSGINALALSTDGSVLYSGACDRSIIVWEKDGGGGGNMVVLGALRGHTNQTVRIWRGVDRSYSCLAVLEGHKGPVKCLTAAIDRYTSSDSSSSCLIYSGSLDCDIKVWQVSDPHP